MTTSRQSRDWDLVASYSLPLQQVLALIQKDDNINQLTSNGVISEKHYYNASSILAFDVSLL